MRFEPRERFSVFVGDNGQGKTNLLEAIYVVATLRSFRTSRLADLITFGQPGTRLGARVLKQDLVRMYEVEVAPGSRKVRLDGKAVRPLARYFGAFNVVVFTPDDLNLARGAPGDRRRFLDRSVFNLEPGYLSLASDHDKVLKQRNATLRQVGHGALSGRRVDEMLDVYDEQLSGLALEISNTRNRFLEQLSSYLGRAFSSISRTGLVASARLSSKVVGLSREAMHEILRAGRSRDLASQSTQVGAHRDDLVFDLDGRDAGSFASQGQLRAIMLAWKTAELSLLGTAHGDLPVLLLDDVSSELDPSRNEYLFEHLASLAGQCFITTTHASHVLVQRERADYRIDGRRILL